MCIWTNFFTLVLFAPTLREVAPTWVYLSFGAGIFIYQVMDNIDGKQARRTQSSSPLGELFDHGCDSLFVTISGITICSAIHCGDWQSWLMINIGTFPFYLSHWEEYHSGILILGKVGNPTEAQLLMIAIHLLAAVFTPLFFAQTLGNFLASIGLSALSYVLPSFIANITLNWVVMFASSMASLGLVVADNFKVVYNHNKKTNGSFFKSLLMLIPFFLHIISTYTWFRVSKAHILQNHLILSIVFYGVVISYMLNRMMIDRITKIPHNPAKYKSNQRLVFWFSIVSPCPSTEVLDKCPRDADVIRHSQSRILGSHQSEICS